jgi:hypothetical protein
MTADELRALVAQGPAVVMASREDMLALLDAREAWQRCAATMATACARGQPIEALDVWKQHLARKVTRAVEGER